MRGVKYRLLGIFGFVASSFALCALLIAPAPAQPPSPSASTDSELSEITVTAERRSEKIEDVPATVNVISASELAQNNIVRLDQLSQLAPSTNIAHYGIYIQPTIRGITTQVIGPGQENNIATYVDGFYEPDATTIGADLVNVESIEILEGPQGSLYGRSATGGAILINTRGPTKEFTADIEGGYANYNDRKITTFVGGPITDRLSYSISGYWHDGNGYIRGAPQSVVAPVCGAPSVALGGIPCSLGNYAGVDFSNAAPLNDWDARVKLKYAITDHLDATLSYHYFYYSDPSGLAFTTTYFSPNLIPPGSPLVVTAPNQTNGYVPAISGRPPGAIVSAQPGNEYGLLVKWDAPYGTLTSHTFYSGSLSASGMNQDATPLAISADQAVFTRETTEEALDFSTTKIDRLTLLAGAFYYHDLGENQAGFQSNTLYLTSPTSWVRTSIFDGNSVDQLASYSYSGYLDATFAVTPKLFVTAGGRYNYDHKAYNAFLGGNINVPAFGLNLPYGPNVVPVENASFHNTTPRANVRYALAENTDVYATFSQGFKAGTFNSINATNVNLLTAPVKPELATNYEVGYKMRRGIYAFSASTYYTRFSDQQVATDYNIPILGLQAALTNANSRVYGIELQNELQPFTALVVQANFAWTHARYTSYPDAFTPLGTFENKDGEQLPRAADYTGNLNVVYTIPNVYSGSLNFGGNIYATSGFTPNVSEVGTTAVNLGPGTVGQNLFYQKGYQLINLQATWAAKDHWSTQLWCNNVASRNYKIYNTGGSISLSGAPPDSPYAYTTNGPPRTFGVKVSYTF
jgi:iron complex outermembrane recepter protein